MLNSVALENNLSINFSNLSGVPPQVSKARGTTSLLKASHQSSNFVILRASRCFKA